MRVTVIPEDKIIVVDGVAKTLDFAAPAGMHALQWHGSYGFIEWKTKGQEHFILAEIVQPYIDAWYAVPLPQADAVTPDIPSSQP